MLAHPICLCLAMIVYTVTPLAGLKAPEMPKITPLKIFFLVVINREG